MVEHIRRALSIPILVLTLMAATSAVCPAWEWCSTSEEVSRPTAEAPACHEMQEARPESSDSEARSADDGCCVQPGSWLEAKVDRRLTDPDLRSAAIARQHQVARPFALRNLERALQPSADAPPRPFVLMFASLLL